MEKLMETNKYSRGKIYRIYAGDKEYIGSTIQSLSDRMAGHRDPSKGNCMCRKLFEEYGIENCRIELIEEYPCNSKEELLWRERYYIETRDCINKKLPIRTEEERVGKRKTPEEKEQAKQRAIERRREAKRQYHITHMEQEREQQRQYRITHREQVRERKRQYRREHREQHRLSEQRRRNRCNGIGLFVMGY